MFGDELLRSQAIVTHSYVSRTFCQLFVLQASDVTSVLSAFPTEAAVMAKMMKGKGGGRPQVMPDIMFVDMHAGRWWRLPLFSYRSRIGNLIARTQEVIALYNAFAVLLRIGFDLHHTMLISVLSFDAFVDMLSTFCIIALFHQQYSFNGELVSSRRAIARKYLTGERCCYCSVRSIPIRYRRRVLLRHAGIASIAFHQHVQPHVSRAAPSGPGAILRRQAGDHCADDRC